MLLCKEGSFSRHSDSNKRWTLNPCSWAVSVVTPEEVATSARLGKLRPGENPVWKGGGSFRRKRARMFKALCDTCLRGLLAWCMISFLAIPKRCRSCFASGVISLQNSRVLRVRTSYHYPIQIKNHTTACNNPWGGQGVHSWCLGSKLFGVMVCLSLRLETGNF